jgi:hypothetical protein
LKNVYAKFQVRSRIKLILKLGIATGRFGVEKPGRSTVDGMTKVAENDVKQFLNRNKYQNQQGVQLLPNRLTTQA